MGKPGIEIYDKFREKYMNLSAACGKEQYLVPYLMSSHPGSTMDDAARLALYTKKIGLAPEQVQDFYPTPGTASTVMYYTGIDPFSGKKVFTATDYHEKQLQRALLQWRKPENRRKIYEAMNYCSEEGQADLRELLGIPRNPIPKKEKDGDRQEKPQQNKQQQSKPQNGGRSGSRSQNQGQKSQKNTRSDDFRSKNSGKSNGKGGHSGTHTGGNKKFDNRKPKTNRNKT